jgi:toxin HigB-1
MIINFKNKIAQDIYDGIDSKLARKLPVELHIKTRRLLDQLNAATKIETLRVPPGNHLEKLKGSLKEHWSLRINIKWRVIFRWNDGKVFDVEIIDYH